MPQATADLQRELKVIRNLVDREMLPMLELLEKGEGSRPALLATLGKNMEQLDEDYKRCKEEFREFKGENPN